MKAIFETFLGYVRSLFLSKDILKANIVAEKLGIKYVGKIEEGELPYVRHKACGEIIRIGLTEEGKRVMYCCECKTILSTHPTL